MSERHLVADRQEGVSVAPHEFEPLGRFRHRKKCRACYLIAALHPYPGWVPARPLGDKSDGLPGVSRG